MHFSSKHYVIFTDVSISPFQDYVWKKFISLYVYNSFFPFLLYNMEITQNHYVRTVLKCNKFMNENACLFYWTWSHFYWQKHSAIPQLWSFCSVVKKMFNCILAQMSHRGNGKLRQAIQFRHNYNKLLHFFRMKMHVWSLIIISFSEVHFFFNS